MATQLDNKELDIQEQLASIRRHMAEIDQRYVETELTRQNMRYEPIKLLAAGLTAGAAIFAAGATFVKLFL